jgi:3-dehydroquinate synthase
MTTSQSCARVAVGLGGRAYQILIGNHALDQLPAACAALPGRRIAIVTNATLDRLHGSTLRRCIESSGKGVATIVLEDGEQHKNAASLALIYDALLRDRFDRQSTIVAFGGGVVGDIAGYAAATFLRGIRYIQVPTTLLAMVDSSVGGKTGINHPLGKNMIGAFHQPTLVIADTRFLETLPDREFRSGLAEVAKYGLIVDPAFFAWLEANCGALLSRDAPAVTRAISRSCEIKAAVVADDEFETRAESGRVLLNLGHTFGHAIEKVLGYGNWLHGEAVACGTVLAADYSRRLGLVCIDVKQRIAALFDAFGLPTELPALAPTDLVSAMMQDKKNADDLIRLVVLKGIGSATTTFASGTDVEQFLRNPHAAAYAAGNP